MTRTRLAKHPKSAPKTAKGLPDKEALIAYLREHGQSGKADLARHFGLKGADRRALRMMLRELEDEGKLGRRGRRGFAEAGAFPPVGVADVVERDLDGELYVRLVKGAEDLPLARLVPDRNERAQRAPGLGDRLLVRFEQRPDEVQARLIKHLGEGERKILGVVRRADRQVRLEPVEKRARDSYVLPEAGELKDGDLVLAQAGAATERYGPKRARVLEVIGREDDPRAASILAIHEHGIPTGFTAAAEAEAEAAEPPTLSGRTDLRDIPLVTIDPVDAR
ncbi:MAG TPA: ribonuclease R, partial [Caulobacteraceae bacterium]|nr:ribonuclease R [Caulobacteraceae bacterium]